MFQDNAEQRKYIIENYEEVTDSRIAGEHWDLYCSVCGVVRGFVMLKQQVATTIRGAKQFSDTIDFDAPTCLTFKCPVCARYKRWIAFGVYASDFEDSRYFKLMSLPPDGTEDIAELPETPPALRIAFRQAVRAMDANAHIAAAAMYRRALQVITRDILKAKPGNLANELKECVGKTLNGVTLTRNFEDVGYIIKEAGNQGAHPDADPDLLEFTAEDARDLHGIFMELVAEIFVQPAATKRARDEFMKRRKIVPKGSAE